MSEFAIRGYSSSHPSSDVTAGAVQVVALLGFFFLLKHQELEDNHNT